MIARPAVNIRISVFSYCTMCDKDDPFHMFKSPLPKPFHGWIVRHQCCLCGQNFILPPNSHIKISHHFCHIFQLYAGTPVNVSKVLFHIRKWFDMESCHIIHNQSELSEAAASSGGAVLCGSMPPASIHLPVSLPHNWHKLNIKSKYDDISTFCKNNGIPSNNTHD